MAWLATAWKFRDVAYLLAIAVLVAWGEGLSLKIAGTELKIVNARLEAQQKAAALSDELIIEQAKAMAVTEKKVVSYVDRIRTVQANDGACPADERMRIGNHGVRDIVRGDGPPAVGGAPVAVPGPRPGAQP